MIIKVLVVDDSMINLKVAKKLLEYLGLEVDTVMSGQECLEVVNKKSYDLIFMDIMMPEMDGIETYQHLRKLTDFKTPVVVLTADAAVGAKEKYLKLGFADYIAKPINLEQLRMIVRKYKED